MPLDRHIVICDPSITSAEVVFHPEERDASVLKIDIHHASVLQDNLGCLVDRFGIRNIKLAIEKFSSHNSVDDVQLVHQLRPGHLRRNADIGRIAVLATFLVVDRDMGIWDRVEYISFIFFRIFDLIDVRIEILVRLLAVYSHQQALPLGESECEYKVLEKQ